MVQKKESAGIDQSYDKVVNACQDVEDAQEVEFQKVAIVLLPCYILNWPWCGVRKNSGICK